MTTRNDLAEVPTLPLPQTDVDLVTPPLGAEHLLLILPNEEGELQAAAMENFFQACATDDPFSLELVGTRRVQGFVLRASSAEQLVLLSKQLSAQYPQAELHRIAPAADPLVLQSGEHAVIGTLAMAQKPWMPLKTFSGKVLAERGADPLAGILAAMEPLGSRQRSVSQLTLVRALDSWIARDIRKSVEHPLQQERDTIGKQSPPTTESAEGMKTLLLVGGIFGTLLGYRWYSTHAWIQLTLLFVAVALGGLALLWWKIRAGQEVVYDMKLVSEKLSRQAFYTVLRVIVIGQQATSTQEQLQTHIKRLEVAYRQFSLSSANSLFLKRMRTVLPNHPRATQLPDPASAFPYRHPFLRLLHGGAHAPDIWNGLELSGAFHLPQSFTDLPLVQRLSVKHLLASPEIAHQIEQAKAPLPPALIGYSRHRGYSIPVYLPYQTLFSHKFLAARSRYGKSTLIQLLAQAAMQPVRDGSSLQPGLFVIDPHKDLIDDLLKMIPPGRAKDVVLFDLTDTQYVIALNPLDASMGFSRDQAIANLMSCFERIWSDFWGPRMAYFLKAICLFLYTLNQQKVQSGHPEQQYTLLDINPLLQYPDYALQALMELNRQETWHQELLAWWQHVYFALPPQSSFRSEVIMPIVSKLGLFQDNQQLRRIVGQPVTKAPVHLSITEGKIVLCALSARDMDDAAVNVIGSTLVNLLHRAFGRQQEVPLAERRNVFCAADEFQAFAGGDWDRLLSEDAKFGCSLLLATQNLKRLNKIRDGLLEMVLSNCDNLFAFNVSAADASILEEELRGVVEPKHIISQPRLHCYARLSLPDHPQQIVSMALSTPSSWRPSPAHQRAADAIRQETQRHLAHASAIDQQYAQHAAQYLDVTSFTQKVQRDVRGTQHQQQQRTRAEQLAAQVREDQQKRQHPMPPPSASQTKASPDDVSSSEQPRQAKAEAARRLAHIQQGVFWLGTEHTLTRQRHYNLVFLHARRRPFPAFAEIARALQEVWPWGEVATVEEVESRLALRWPTNMVEAAIWKVVGDGLAAGHLLVDLEKHTLDRKVPLALLPPDAPSQVPDALPEALLLEAEVPPQAILLESPPSVSDTTFDASVLSDAQRERFHRNLQAVEQVLAGAQQTKVAASSGIPRSTLGRLVRRTRQLGQIACVPLGTYVRKTTMHPAFQECIRRLFLLPTRLSMIALTSHTEMSQVAARLSSQTGAEVSIPSYKQVRTEIARLKKDPDLMAVRERAKSLPRPRSSPESFVLSLPSPALLAQVDEHSLELYVVTPDGIAVTERVHAAVLICVKTAAILGAVLALGPLKEEDYMRLVKQALEPKDRLVGLMGCEHPWPCYGKPAIIFHDRGKIFTSERVRQVLVDRLGIITEQAPPYAPSAKGTVESLFRWMTQRFERRLPNTSHGVHDAKTAAEAGGMTLEELERCFYQAIVDDYQQDWDKLRRQKRCVHWEHAVAQSGVPQYLGSGDDLKLLLMKAINRKTPGHGYHTSSGNRLSFHGRWYVCPGLLSRLAGREFEVYYDRRDIGVLYLFVDGTYLGEAYCTQFMGGRVSEWEAKAMRKHDEEQAKVAREQGQQTRARIQEEAGRSRKRRNGEIRQAERGRQWDRQREEIHPAEVLERLASVEEKKPVQTKLPPAVRDADPDRPVRPLRIRILREEP